MRCRLLDRTQLGGRVAWVWQRPSRPPRCPPPRGMRGIPGAPALAAASCFRVIELESNATRTWGQRSEDVPEHALGSFDAPRLRGFYCSDVPDLRPGRITGVIRPASL